MIFSHFRNNVYFKNPTRKYPQRYRFLTGVLDTGGKAGKLISPTPAINFAGVPTPPSQVSSLKVHKNENFFGFDFEFCPISLLVMHK
jgi:hypothetical protein